MLQKTDICFWIFRDRVKLCHHSEMVSFFIHKLTVYCWTRHCRKIRTNMSACWAMSMQLQDIVTRRRRICLALAYCYLIKCRSFVCYEILFISLPFSLCSPCGFPISLKFKNSLIKTFSNYVGLSLSKYCKMICFMESIISTYLS